jgi:hypothetical protein
MFLVQIKFGSDGANRRHRESLQNIAENYLSSLLWNGQVCGDYWLAWSNGKLIGYTRVPRPDSFAKRYHSEWSVSALNKLVEAFGRDPKWEIKACSNWGVQT